MFMKINEYKQMMKYLTRPAVGQVKEQPEKILPVDHANAKKYGITPKTANYLRNTGEIDVQTDSTKQFEKKITEARAKGQLAEPKGPFEQVYDNVTKKKTEIKKKYSIPFSQPVINEALKVSEDILVKKSQNKEPKLIIQEDPDLSRGLGYLIGYQPRERKI